jgi:hypothetical protein
MTVRLLVFRARLVGINSTSFSLIFALQRFFGFSERGKATFSVGLYSETKPSGSLLPLGTRDCET